MNFKWTFFLISLACSQAVFSSCGTYLVQAQVVMKEGFSTLVINPGTKSEINLKVQFNESAKLSPYIDRFIETKATIEEKMDFTRGVVASLGEIKELVPEPLSTSRGTKFQLLSAKACP